MTATEEKKVCFRCKQKIENKLNVFTMVKLQKGKDNVYAYGHYDCPIDAKDLKIVREC